MNSRRILFVLQRLGSGGAERVATLLAGALADSGDDVTVLTLVGGDSFYPLGDKVGYKSLGVKVARKNPIVRVLGKILFFPKAFFGVRSEIKKGNYDLVFSLLTTTDRLVGWCKKTGLSFNHVCSERCDPWERTPAKLAQLTKIYKNSSLFVCQSQKVADFYNEVPASVKVVIPNPVDCGKLPARPGSAAKKIVAVGRLDSQKNFGLLIDGFAGVAGEFPDYKVEIYGEGYAHSELQNKIDGMGLSDRITLCGARRDVLERIADAELFVMTSDYEGFPNALLEAIAIGLPVISTDFPTGTARELVGSENGIVIPVGDREALTAAMRELLGNEEKRRAMSLSNREKGKEYDIPVVIGLWKDAFDRVTKGNEI